jgi:cell division septation protein DedD/nucleoid DNA-binding protein
MDISSYIGELLFEHDCVIVPGFGGFICSYRAAEIQPVLNTISPPSKAISFNRHLQSNDGLLVNHVANSLGITFDAATALVNGWAAASNNQLQKREEITLRKIGRFCNDIEGNLQFNPFNEVNYLKSSFGLPALSAEPVLREKEVEFTEQFNNQTRQVSINRGPWRIAAAIALLVGLGVLGGLMWGGVEIKGLRLNEAGTFKFLTNIFTVPEPEIQPVAVEPKTSAPVAETNTATPVVENNTGTPSNAESDASVKEETPSANGQEATGPVYYIVIGAFAQESNVQSAKEKLEQKFPDSLILMEKGHRITRLGYSVGNDLAKAKEQLSAAQAEDSSYWLLKK